MSLSRDRRPVLEHFYFRFAILDHVFVSLSVCIYARLNIPKKCARANFTNFFVYIAHDSSFSGSIAIQVYYVLPVL